MTVEQQVKQVAADVFNLPSESITAESSPQTIDSWDSVQHLNLVLALESTLGVQIDPEDIERMQTIGAVVELMERKKRS
jgi:acyl carrier protein